MCQYIPYCVVFLVFFSVHIRNVDIVNETFVQDSTLQETKKSIYCPVYFVFLSTNLDFQLMQLPEKPFSTPQNVPSALSPAFPSRHPQ